MKFLIFSDLHEFQKESIEKIQDNFDLIVFLGDIKASTIQYIMDCFPDKKTYGVLGNHDDANLFQSINKINEIKYKHNLNKAITILNIHLAKVELGELSFTGLEGSLKYKDHMIGYTQQDYLDFDIPNSKILFSHDSGYLYFPYKKGDLSHEGLIAISKYVKEKQPEYHIFGHHHSHSEFIKNNTKCICIYGCSLFDYSLGTIKYYF